MKLSRSISLTVIVSAAIFIVACKTSKKTTAPVTPATTTATTPASGGVSVMAPVMTKSPNGIYTPGNEELTAIKVSYPDATLEKLKEGHSLYTTGACIRCHGPKNIYTRGEAQWKNIMDDMALRAHITPAEKEAVTQYVLSIKATQSK